MALEDPSRQPRLVAQVGCFFFRSALLTAQDGRALAVHHAGRQRAVVRRRAAEQDVVGQGLVQHGAVGAGVGALAVAAHALVRQRPVQGASRRQGALQGRKGGRGRGDSFIKVGR